MSIDPIQSLRREQADRVVKQREELFQAFKDAVAEDVAHTINQQEEFEATVAQDSRWLTDNTPRLTAILPIVLKSLTAYEMNLGRYRSQINAILTETMQVTQNSVWGHRIDGQRDENQFRAVVSSIKQRLGQSRGLSGQIHRDFLAIEVELCALERRGFGLPPEPAPQMKPPPDPSTAQLTSNTKFNARAQK